MSQSRSQSVASAAPVEKPNGFRQLRTSDTIPHRRTTAGLAALIALLLSDVSPVAAQPAWTGVVIEVPGVQPASRNSMDLVGDDVGNAIAIWEGPISTGQPTSIQVAHFSAVTKAWAAPVVLQANGSSPGIAMNSNGDAVAVWNECCAARQVRAARYSASSATWSAPVTIITSAAQSFSSPQIAVDPQGNATAIWVKFGGSNQSQIQAARYTAASGVWGGPVDATPLVSNPGLAAQPRVVMDASGHATAVFWAGALGVRALYASRSSAGGTSWSSPEALRVDNGSSAATLTVDAAGNVLVAWPASQGATVGVLAARYVAAVGAWSNTHTLSQAGQDPQVVVDDVGNATVVWSQIQGQGATVASSTYSASSDTWSSPQPLGAVGFAVQLGLAVDGAGTITAVWGSANGRYAARRVSGQPWTAPVMLVERSGDSSFVAASASGDVTVLWSDLLSTRWSSSGAEAVSAPIALTVATNFIWYGEAELGAPLTVSWSAPQTGLPVTGYRLQAGTSFGASNLADLDVGMTTRVVTTVPPIRRVFLRVIAMSGSMVSPPSKGNGFVVYGVCSELSTPSALTHTVSGGTVTLTWQAASGAVTYALEAGTAPGLANLASTNIGSATRFSAIAPPGTYYVRVRAENYCGASGPSNEVVVTIAGPNAPGAPVLNTPVVTGNTVSLSWFPGSGASPTGYTLSASVAPGGAPIATVPLSGTSASFAGVPSGTYYLRLTASNAGGAGPSSAPVTLTVP